MLAFLRNLGDGTFDAPVAFALASDSNREAPAGVCHGDFNLDGNVDIATCNADSNDVSVMHNAGIAIFELGIEQPVGDNPDCPAMIAADLNHDGDVDLVTFNEAATTSPSLRTRFASV